jgi:succinate dehydrogenase/fumarate reductase flavoprotein subunit
VIDADVLVIGGGAAGMCAAIEASKQGVNVLLVTKGLLGKSGCSVEAANFRSPPFYSSCEIKKKSWTTWVQSSGYLCNQDVVKTIVEKGCDYVRELEELGVYWRRYPDGSFVIDRTETRIYSSKSGDTGKSVVDVLRGEILRRGIDVLNETVVTSLLTQGGRGVGATALNYVDGEFLVMRSKSVVLAAGGGGYLWTYSTATREVTADGLAMAYRVGAELTGLEIQSWHMADLARPVGTSPNACSRLQIYPEYAPPGDWAPHFYNSKGERIQELGGAEKQWRMLAVCREVKKGLADKTGGYYASLKHVDPKVLEEYYYQYPFLRKYGIDTTKDLIEVGMAAHTMLGGVRINEKAETTVSGLYAAGGNAGTFIPCLMNAVWGGKTSAKYASASAKEKETPQLDWQQVKKEEERVFSFLRKEPVAGFSPHQISRRIREIMYDKMHFIKHEETMKEALNALQKVREDMVPRMRLPSITRRFNYDWVCALDVMNMLDVAELIAEASLLRKESREHFQREDYPETDNKDWLRSIIVRLDGGKPRFYTAPVELTYIKPGD